MHIPVTLFNTKSRTLELFTEKTPGEVLMYSCGPTVYHYAHIGNLRAYVFADTLRRMFTELGYNVQHVINITDVGHLTGDGDDGEDKLEKGAAREGKTAWDVATYYTDAFMKDIGALNIPKECFIFPKATDHIPEQIELIKRLEEKGYTYTIHDGVYFDTAQCKTYGDFARLNLSGQEHGARVEENKEKRNPTDFALWKFSPHDTKRHMEWDSPWGKGFPGWHIECSAMSMKYLGNHFDIHTGGIDHIPVHHTNEIAQSECATGEPYVNYWMHVNFLNDTTGKMSKSNDDFLTLSTLIEKGYDPLAYRYFLLMTHYKKEVTFSYEALDAAQTAYKKLYTWAEEHVTDTGVVNTTHKHRFLQTLAGDLSTPTCIADIWNLLKDTSITDADKYATLLMMSRTLGLGLEHAKKNTIEISKEVQDLLDKRANARTSKDFALSDALRDEIASHGFTVKDTAEGQELLRI